MVNDHKSWQCEAKISSNNSKFQSQTILTNWQLNANPQLQWSKWTVSSTSKHHWSVTSVSIPKSQLQSCKSLRKKDKTRTEHESVCRTQRWWHRSLDWQMRQWLQCWFRQPIQQQQNKTKDISMEEQIMRDCEHTNEHLVHNLTIQHTANHCSVFVAWCRMDCEIDVELSRATVQCMTKF